MSSDGFILLGKDGDETRLIADRRSGYSLPVPGRPRATAEPRFEGPTAELWVALDDAPIELSFRLDQLPPDTEAVALAVALATAYATGRAAREPKVSSLTGELRGRGVDGAAATIYPLAGVDAPPAMEHLNVAVKRHADGIWAVYRATRFSNVEVKSIVWSQFRTAIDGAAHWDPNEPRTEVPTLWPSESDFAELDIRLQLVPGQASETRSKRDALSAIPRGEGGQLVETLAAIGNSPGKPVQPVPPFVKDKIEQSIADASPSPEIAAALTRNLDSVQTMHDLRAWAWQCLYAFDRRNAH